MEQQHHTDAETEHQLVVAELSRLFRGVLFTDAAALFLHLIGLADLLSTKHINAFNFFAMAAGFATFSSGVQKGNRLMALYKKRQDEINNMPKKQ